MFHFPKFQEIEPLIPNITEQEKIELFFHFHLEMLENETSYVSVPLDFKYQLFQVENGTLLQNFFLTYREKVVPFSKFMENETVSFSQTKFSVSPSKWLLNY